jgi:hypothetical protein
MIQDSTGASPAWVPSRLYMTTKSSVGVVSIIVFSAAFSYAQDAKFAADSFKYSRDFYSKVHFVAITDQRQPFKYDRYPSDGPERIQCDDGSYLRQHRKPWKYLPDPMRVGIPIDYPEHNRYFMTFALRTTWGREGKVVDDATTQTLDGWIKMIDAALNSAPSRLKQIEKSEAGGRTQWVFEASAENAGGAPTQFTFRKPASDKSDNVLLHEFSGPLRIENGQVVPGAPSDVVKIGFGYMMVYQGNEVSEFVWEQDFGKGANEAVHKEHHEAETEGRSHN